METQLAKKVPSSPVPVPGAVPTARDERRGVVGFLFGCRTAVEVEGGCYIFHL